MTMESDLQAQIEFSSAGTRGTAGCSATIAGVQAGKVVHRDRDTVTLKHPRQVEAGPVNGASDLIGWSSVFGASQSVNQGPRAAHRS